MASLTSARDQLVALKVQLDKTQKEYLALLDANPGADTTAILATIASLNTQITSQKATVRQLKRQCGQWFCAGPFFLYRFGSR